MSNERIDMHRLQDLVRLHRQGVGYRKIARLLKMSPNTERKYRDALTQAGLLEGEPDEIVALDLLREAVGEQIPCADTPQQTSSIEVFKDDIAQMLAKKAGPKAIYDLLRLERSDFAGSLSAVKRMCLRINQERGPRPEDVVLVVQTAPGEVAQVDFGYVGKLFDPISGRIRRAYAFVMVLGFSRLMYVDLVFDQSSATWLKLHVDAFEYLGGVPETVVPDNLKAAVVKSFFGLKDKPELNRSYRELGRHYGFMIDPTPPYAPEKKGKVESAVKYVKSNFFAPRDLEELDQARTQLARWLDEIANQRVHGTTKQVPREVFEELEADTLSALPPTRWQPVIWKRAMVHPDSHVEFERRLYSVPFRLMGQEVWLRARGKTIDVFFEDKRITSHQRSEARYNTKEAHLPEGRRDLRHRGRQWWQDKADKMSPVVGEYIEEVFGADDVFNQLRCVQSIVGYLEQFPIERAEGACRRARLFGNYTYQGIKRILVEGIDLEPVMPQAVYIHGKLENPRFARSISELVAPKEVNDECN
jgi:transposase